MTRYVYRRKPTREDIGTALGAGAAAGIAVGATVAYLAQIFLRRATMGSEASGASESRGGNDASIRSVVGGDPNRRTDRAAAEPGRRAGAAPIARP